MSHQSHPATAEGIPYSHQPASGNPTPSLAAPPQTDFLQERAFVTMWTLLHELQSSVLLDYKGQQISDMRAFGNMSDLLKEMKPSILSLSGWHRC